MNHLAQEKSPYLLQHKNNPVDWFPWGEEAFAKARRENKPIFLSIGYSTCYWCHMMEKDSFELEQVAAVLNAHYVAIKLDREERPDIDKIYMDAVVGLTGHGGWPMSVFLTPDLKPFYGGTFFWRDQFIKLLLGIAESWEKNLDAIEKNAEQLTNFLRDTNVDRTPVVLDETLFEAFIDQLKLRFDSTYGGFGGAPKFPPSQAVTLLLRLHERTDNSEALQMATVTLDRMARGGIFDHLGGGFARYSTDKYWLVPHFEKMLYDNAQLACAYLDAYRITKNEMFAAVARETLDYVLRVMTAPEGGFYSAEDAGEVNKEGDFYVWFYDELAAVLTNDELSKLTTVYGITPEGNFEHKNIFNLQNSIDWKIKSEPIVKNAHEKLFAARERRPHPHKDDKVLTAWNGLMISAMARGGQILGETRYKNAAQSAARFIQSHLIQNGKLLRRYRDQASGMSGQLDDYAYFIQGLVDLFETDGNEQWVLYAAELQDTQNKLFWDNAVGGYYYSAPGDTSVIVRKKDFHDGAEPSPNAIAALNLCRLYFLTANPNFLERAEQLFAVVSSELALQPIAHASFLNAFEFYRSTAKDAFVCATDGYCRKPPVHIPTQP